METTKLNSMQLYMIKLFDRKIDLKQEAEIKKILADYFAKQIDEEMDLIWEQRGMTQKDLDELLNKHLRTPYT